MYFPRSKSSYTLAGSTTIDIKKIEFTTKLNLFIMTYYSEVVPNGGETRIRYTNIGPVYLVKKKKFKRLSPCFIIIKTVLLYGRRLGHKRENPRNTT